MSKRAVVCGAALAFAVLATSGLPAQPPSAGRDPPGDTAHLALIEAVSLALAGHPTVASAQAERDRAGAVAAEVRSAWWPRVTTEWSAMRFEEPMVVSPIHGFTPDRVPAFDRTLLQGGVGATWLLFDGGARSSRIARAESGAEAAEAGVEAARAALIAAVARAYLGVLTARETLAAHDARLVALAAERERAERLFTEGSSARVGVLRAEAASSRAAADRVAAAAQLREREAELGRLTGLDPSAVSRLSLDAVVAADGPVETAAELRRRAAAADPAVVRARHAAEAARAAVGEARGAYLPTLSLSGRFNEYGNGDGSFTGEWQGGVQLSYALFTGGARGDAVERARAEARVSEAAVALAELEAEAAVDRALSALEEATARADALAAAVEQFEEVVAVERLAADAGAGVQTDYLAAESDLLEARAALSAARLAEVSARIELARVTGRLSPDWLATNLEIRR